MGKRLSLRQYAKSRKDRGLEGGTLHAVQRAIAEQRISTVDGKIDPDVADREWAENSRNEQTESYSEARARKEQALADMAEMEAAEMRGEMCFTKDVAECWGEIAAAIRARALILPAMLAPQIAPAGKAAEVQGILRKAINEMLEELSADGVPKAARGRKKRHAEDPETTS